MQREMRENVRQIAGWQPRTGSGWMLTYHILRLNGASLSAMLALSVVAAGLFYAPALFIERLVAYLEVNPDRREMAWGWVYVVGIFVANTTMCLGTSWCLLHNQPNANEVYVQLSNTCGRLQPTSSKFAYACS